MVEYPVRFEWDPWKNWVNRLKHGVSFEVAQCVFLDPRHVVVRDEKHDLPDEQRFFCMGKVNQAVLTVRFTKRGDKIRIFGAAEWRKGRKVYERENSL